MGSVTANKLLFSDSLSKKEFKITRVSLPSKEDILEISTCAPEKLAIYCSWWLKNGSYIRTGESVVKYTTAEFKKYKGIRVILEFNSSVLKPGDEFYYKNALFYIYTEGKAISKAVINFSKYKDINDVLFQWHFSPLDERVYQIISKEPFVLCHDDIEIMPARVASSFNQTDLAPTLTFWLRERKDEFTGYCISSFGNIQKVDISETLCVCPSLHTLVIPNIISMFMYFETDGILWKKIGTFPMVFDAIALNPIGASCYSSGIEEVNGSENDFYLSSELANVLAEWEKYVEFK